MAKITREMLEKVRDDGWKAGSVLPINTASGKCCALGAAVLAAGLKMENRGDTNEAEKLVAEWAGVDAKELKDVWERNDMRMHDGYSDGLDPVELWLECLQTVDGLA